MYGYAHLCTVIIQIFFTRAQAAQHDDETVHHGLVVNTPALYSGGLRLKSLPGNKLS